MANGIEEAILERFREASRGTGLSDAGWGAAAFAADQAELSSAIGEATRAVERLTGATRVQESVTVQTARTPAPPPYGVKGSTEGGGGSVVSTLLKTGLGFVPLARGILSLFGGGSDEAKETAPVKYYAPASVRIEQALWRGSTGEASYDQSGLVRPVAALPAARDERAPAERIDAVEAARSEARTVVNVTVQAMDSRSFLDHSHEIARAVREAMLSMNPINDVVNDL